MTEASGDLARRIAKNIERLKSEEYRYPKIFEREDDWPGDWAGRTLLALCEQYEATGRSDRELFSRMNEIVKGLPRALNENCYFGALFDGKTVNEQQLSGNSWFLRALCDYFRITGERGIFVMLQTIADGFLKKLAPFYKRYPKTCGRAEGGVSGSVALCAAEGWRLSSDVGCAFILLDGVTDVYSVLGDEGVLALAQTVAEEFLGFDPYAAGFQTHATLSATRGIARLARLTGERKYLAAAERLFALYAEKGCTINYANFNWFRRPDSWTEPCAFVDSLILAGELYRLTGKEAYLLFANRVYFNAVRTAQRSNGGAGCETCLNEGNAVLRIHMYEAFFCCTMRLANGLNYVRENIFAEKDGAVRVNFALGGRYESADVAFSYAFEAERGEIVLKIERGAVGELRMYLPEGARLVAPNAAREGCFAVLRDLSAGEYSFPLEFTVTEEARCGVKVRFWGDYLLTAKHYPANERISFSFGGKQYSPIGDCIAAEEQFGIDKFVQSV